MTAARRLVVQEMVEWVAVVSLKEAADVDKANVSASPEATPTQVWVPAADGDFRGAHGAQGAAAEGPEAARAVAARREGPMGRLGRLRRAEVDRVFREGTVASGPFFVVRVAPNDLGVSRWAFAAGRRVFPRATDRNRVRRRLRAAAEAVGARAGVDIVVIARAEALGGPFAGLVEEMRRLCEGLGVR